MIVRTLSTLAATALAAAVAIPAAHAARYDYTACPSPDSAGLNPWSSQTNASHIYTFESGCETADGKAGISLIYGDVFNDYANGRLLHALPGGVDLVGVNVTRDASAETAAPYWDASAIQTGLFARTGFSTYVPLDTVEGTPGQPAATLSGERHVHLDAPIHPSQLALRAFCGDTEALGDWCYEPRASYAMSRPEVEVVDDTAPDGTVLGTLALDPVLSGKESYTVNAQDFGIGVIGARLRIDGKVVREISLGAGCAPIRTGAVPLYGRGTPCDTAATDDAVLDTTDLANGEHRFVIDAQDALGNSATLMDRTVTVDNRAGATPTITSDASIAGNATVGEALTASPPAVDTHGTGAVTHAYQWMRCGTDAAACRPIRDATTATRTVNPADVGSRLRIRVTATTRGGSVESTSNATPVVTDKANDDPAPPPVTASGTTTVVTTSVPPSHEEVLTLSLLSPTRKQMRRGSEVVIGGVTRTGEGQLKARIPVAIQENRRGQWRTITTVATRRNGTFLTAITLRKTMRLRAICSDLVPGTFTASRVLRVGPRRPR